MHVIARPNIFAAAQRFPTKRSWIDAWLSAASGARWTNLNDVREAYRSTDLVGTCLVFNAGDHFRLIVGVVWAGADRLGHLYFKGFVTHAVYERGRWRSECNC